MAHTTTEHPPSRRANPYHRVAVVGAGAWGTALAALARRAGAEVALWGRDAETVGSIAGPGRTTPYLPGVELPEGVAATTDLACALRNAEIVLVVVPSQAVRALCAEMAPYLDPGVPVALCAKGIEGGSGLLMTQVAREVLGDRPVGVLSGPTFAREVALGLPTAATVSFEFNYHDRLDPQDSPAARLAVTLSTADFRAYISDDVIGVEVAGAIKNVIAIACGMMTGAGFAENTRAALITRGVDEMKRLAETLGGRRETITGLAGIGDLTLTCSSPTSRNLSYGIQLGEGVPADETFGGAQVVVEGAENSKTVTDLARRVGLHLPICEAVRAVLFDGAPMKESFAGLWSAPIQAEPRSMDLTVDHPTAYRSPGPDPRPRPRSDPPKE